jgi:hypothetical protein
MTSTPNAPVSLDEAVPALPAISDEQVRAVIRAAIAEGDLDSTFDGYDGWNFEGGVDGVMSVIAKADLHGPYEVGFTFAHDMGDGTTSGGQVFVKTPNGGPTLSGPWNDLRHLTEDRTEIGIDAYVAIADVLLGDIALTVTRARAWAATFTPSA